MRAAVVKDHRIPVLRRPMPASLMRPWHWPGIPERYLRAGLIALATLCGGLTACDSGSTPQGSAGSPAAAVDIHGSISNKGGPITRGRLDAVDAGGSTIASVTLDGSEHYQLQLPAGTRFPVVMTATPETAPEALERQKEPVRAVLADAPQDRVDLSPLSTKVVEYAQARGGFTRRNIEDAARAAAMERMMGGGGDAGGGGGHGGH